MMPGRYPRRISRMPGLLRRQVLSVPLSWSLNCTCRIPESSIVSSIHVEWTRPAASTKPERDPEQIRRGGEAESVPPIAPAPAQDVDAREVISAAPPMTARPPKGGNQERESKRVGAHGKKNSRGAAREGSRPHPFESLTVGDGTHSPKGFWDWSR
jgi:hypothetical protein